MADVLSVIQDILSKDKQQKKEHAKMMREVQKKLKEKEVSEDDGPGDGDKYQKFVQTMLKKFGVKSPSELAPDKKKAFYDALDAGWEADDEKPEPDDKKEESLGDRVKSRMKAEDEEEDDEPKKPFDVDSDSEEEDEDEAPVGDQDNPDTEPEDEEEPAEEPPEEQIDKIADLVLQKIRDKADEEEDEEDEPDSTEAESGKKEKIEINPKVEALHKNPHRRSVWEEALRQVRINEAEGIQAQRNVTKVPEPIPVIIKSVGKQLRDYALKSGGIDRDDFLKISKTMLQGKMPNASVINKMDTDPKEFVFDLMAKTFGWKYTEQYGKFTFFRRRDYVESFQGGHKLEEHCGECGLGLQEGPIQTKLAKSKKGKITVKDHDSLEDAKKHLADMKTKGWNGIISQDGKPIKEEDEVEEGVTGPTRMDVQKAFDKEKGLLRARINATEKALKISDMKVDAKGTVQSFKEEVEINEISMEAGKVYHQDSKEGKMYFKAVEQQKNKRWKGLVLDIGQKKPKNGSADESLRFWKATPDKDIPAALKEDHDKTECPKCKGEGCEHCDGKGYHISEETLAEISLDWLERELKKVQHVWAKIGPNGKHLMDKRAKMKWFDMMDTKQSRSDYTDFEMKDAMDDYGIISDLKAYEKDGSVKASVAKNYRGYLGVPWKEETNLDKLDRWGIDTQKEGYMILPAIDRERYTPMRGLEGPFMTRSGKVVYYDAKAGAYYDRDSDIYLSYGEYEALDQETPAQKAAMKLGPLGDPKSKEFKKMMRDKAKAEKKAKKDSLKNQYESIGMTFARKHYQKDKDSL